MARYLSIDTFKSFQSHGRKSKRRLVLVQRMSRLWRAATSNDTVIFELKGGRRRGLSNGNLDECYEEAAKATRKALVSRYVVQPWRWWEGRGDRSLETALGYKSRTKLSPGPAGRCNFKAR